MCCVNYDHYNESQRHTSHQHQERIAAIRATSLSDGAPYQGGPTTPTGTVMPPVSFLVL